MRRRQQRSVWRFLYRRRFLLVLLVVLAGIGALALHTKRWVERHAENVATQEEQLSKQDYDRDPAAYTAMQRQVEISRIVPIIWGLLGLLLVVFVTALIVMIINSHEPWSNESSSDEWVASTREKVRQRRESRD